MLAQASPKLLGFFGQKTDPKRALTNTYNPGRGQRGENFKLALVCSKWQGRVPEPQQTRSQT